MELDLTVPGHNTVNQLAQDAGLAWDSAEFAAHMDEKDELKSFREQFHFPPNPSKKTDTAIYLCGNSLGLQPKNTANYVMEELVKWQQHGVEVREGGLCVSCVMCPVRHQPCLCPNFFLTLPYYFHRATSPT